MQTFLFTVFIWASPSASYPDIFLLISSHGPLRFVTSHSRFAPASMRNHAKNEAPEEEAGI